MFSARCMPLARTPGCGLLGITTRGTFVAWHFRQIPDRPTLARHCRKAAVAARTDRLARLVDRPGFAAAGAGLFNHAALSFGVAFSRRERWMTTIVSMSAPRSPHPGHDPVPDLPHVVAVAREFLGHHRGPTRDSGTLSCGQRNPRCPNRAVVCSPDVTLAKANGAQRDQHDC